MMFSHAAKNKIFLTMGIILISFALVNNAFAASAAPWLSTITGVDAPARIAVDSQGNVYVTEPRNRDRLQVFDRNGKLLRTLSGLSAPLGVALDGSSRIYISNTKTGSVDVYNADFTLSHKLGKGDGEFAQPNSIAVASNGLVYVTDSKAHQIRVYNANGTWSSTIGSWGKTNGQFNNPNALAIDETAGELYVTDAGLFNDPAYGNTAGARIQVFDLQSGGFKRSFGSYGTGEGKIMKPLGIALDGAGKVYVSDGYQCVVHVFDTYGTPAGTVYDNGHQLKTPVGMAIGKDNRLFVASSNGSAVEVFGLPGYTTMSVSPSSLSFEAAEGTGNPASKSATISNSGSGTLSWTAASDRAWITLNQTSGTATNGSPSTLFIGINATGFIMGSYSGTVTITADSGATETVGIQLTVNPPPAVLSVTPSSMTFKAQQNGPAPSAQSIDIRNLAAGEMSWTATSSVNWLTLSADSGNAPASITVTPKTALPLGVNSGTITISAPGAQGSTKTITVSAQITNAGTLVVTTNLSQVKFDISGPASYSGTGTKWSNDEVAPGDYTVTFQHMPGYVKPQAKAVTVKTGAETTVQGDYRKKLPATHIVTGSASAQGRKVVVLALDGAEKASFEPFTSAKSVRVATGDLDGSGLDKIVVTDNKRSVRVYAFDGTSRAAFDFPDTYTNAVVAVGDVDNDGKAAEIIVGAENDNAGVKQRVIKLLSYTKDGLSEKATLYTEDKKGEFTIALGDTDGDAAPELVMADSGSVSAFSIIKGSSLVQLWATQGEFKKTPEVAAGDLNDDGAAEIALSIAYDGNGKDKKDVSVIHLLKGTGEPTETSITTSQNSKGAAAVACGDVDGDGADDIAVGAGGEQNPQVRIFKADGSSLGLPIEVNNGGSGVNVCLGRFQ